VSDQFSSQFVLPETEVPAPESSGLDQAFWEGLTASHLVLQWCPLCEDWRWGPEWICHQCHSFDLEWREVVGPNGQTPRGKIFSWERVWHPADARYGETVPYVVVLVELEAAPKVRLLGNLINPPEGPIPIGATVSAVFEHHREFSLLQWSLVL
jgi:uncharacterized protein